MKYTIEYHECYKDTYEVEANSPEEAKEKLMEDIWNARKNGPQECYDSGAKIISEENDK